jgi:3',5'-cyclic AMP phosphodiesterase CpdA
MTSPPACCLSTRIVAQLRAQRVKMLQKMGFVVVVAGDQIQRIVQVSQLNALRERPDAVVVSGDIVNCGRPEEYQVARQMPRIWRAT